MTEIVPSRRLLDPPPLQAAIVDVASVERDVLISMESGWLTQARAMLASATKLDGIVGTIGQVIDAANDAIESVQFGIPYGDSMALGIAREKTVRWYQEPIIAARKSNADAEIGVDLAIPTLQTLYADQLKLGAPRELIVPASRDDLERIGAQTDFLSMLFWAEIQSTHWRQTPRDLLSLFEAAISDQPMQVRRRRLALGGALESQIHALDAKDTTARWARYFVYVRPQLEAAFFDAVAGKNSVDLEQFGAVIASHYQRDFRARQTELARARFENVVKRYAALAQRERDYSYPASSTGADNFEARRFSTAMIDEGSRHALVNDLVGVAMRNDWVDLPLPPPEPLIEYPYRLQADQAQEFVRLATHQRLPMVQTDFVLRLVAQADAKAVGDFVERLREASELLNGEGDGFDRLVATADHLLREPPAARSPDRPFDANGHSSAPRTEVFGLGQSIAISKSPQRGVARSDGEAIAGRLGSASNQALIGKEAPLRGPLVALAMFRNMDARDTLLSTLSEAVGNGAEQDIVTLEGAIRDISATNLDDIIEIDDDAIVFSAGIRHPGNIRSRLFSVYALEKDHFSSRFFDNIIDNGFIEQTASLCIIGRYIESKPYSEKSAIVSEILSQGLAGAFETAGYPVEKREGFIQTLTDALLVHDREIPDNASTSPPWPSEAPVRWRDRLQVVQRSDQPGEELFSFIRAVYRPWLPDISKQALRKLDPALVNELNAWTRSGNAMPSDINVLTRTQENARLLAGGSEAVLTHLGKFTGEEALREAARLREAQRRSRNS